MTTDTEVHEEQATDDRIRRGEPQPSAAYEGCYDPQEIDAIFRVAFARASDEWGGMFKIPGSVVRELQEDHRRAHVRLLVSVGARRGPSAPRVEVPVVEARGDDEGMITCIGACGERKPATKFPTLHGRPGRAAECRSCRDARKKSDA